ncbi:MAG: ParD-like family protein [Gammaproteobacteria bacterium]|nr:ParD-like family protein [Gammaproteobacteria bacterium]
MSIAVRVSDKLYQAASKVAKAEFRSTAQQIEYWATIGKAALENPDLPTDFVRDILMAKGRDKGALEPFIPETSSSIKKSKGTLKKNK